MNTEAVKQYLGILKDEFAQRANAAGIHDSAEGPVLICSVTSPFDKNAEIAYQISLQDIGDQFVATELMIILFADISKDKQRDISILINRLNQYVSMGSFRLIDDNGMVMFCQGMIFDESMQTAKVTELIFAAIQSMESAVVGLGEYIDRAMNGEDNEKLFSDLQRRHEDG